MITAFDGTSADLGTNVVDKGNEGSQISSGPLILDPIGGGLRVSKALKL